MLMTKCKKHPKYKAQFKPRSKCENCRLIYINTRLSRIASVILGIKTLDTRYSDRLDFHTLPVWQIKRALDMAYCYGQQDFKNSIDK